MEKLKAGQTAPQLADMLVVLLVVHLATKMDLTRVSLTVEPSVG